MTMRMPITRVVTALSQSRLHHGPRTALSLQSSSRKTAAEGRSTPARACTATVIRPNGACGMRTMPPATATKPAKLA